MLLDSEILGSIVFSYYYIKITVIKEIFKVDSKRIIVKLHVGEMNISFRADFIVVRKNYLLSFSDYVRIKKHLPFSFII